MSGLPGSGWMVALASAVVATAAGCGEADGNGTVQGPSFPLRVLEGAERTAGRGHTLFLDELESLDGWWALAASPDGEPLWSTAEELSSSGGLTRSEHGATLEPGTVLLRRVELLETAEHAFTARLRAPGAVAGAACPQLVVLPATKRSGEPYLDPATPDAEQLANLVDALREVEAAPDEGGPRAAWRQSAGPDGFALARFLEWTDVEAASGSSRWVAILALREPVEVDSLRVAVSPQLHVGSDASTRMPAETREIAIEPMRVGGDSRLAAFVPPQRELSLPLVVPPQAADLVLGVCPDPAKVAGLPTGTRLTCRWTVRAQPGNHLLAEIEEVATAARPACFADHVLPWPAGLQGQVTLELTVKGAMGMIFGQPRVRGAEQPGSPSLLLVSIDTLRADHLGALGYERPTSPFLDELAGQGVVFTDVTAVSSYTLPTHASMLTGVFPPRHLALDTADRLNAQRTPTLALRLSQAGFLTAAFTSGGFVAADYGFDAGFDRYTTVDPLTAPPEDPAHGLDVVSAWIRRQGERPWFVFLHTYAVHDYAPPDEDLALFEREPPPEGFWPFDLLDRRHDLPVPPTPVELGRLVDLYDASIHAVDRRLRELIEPLREEGLLDDTWIVVTADHGEEFLEHGGLRHAGTLYEELLRVPLIVVPPAIAAVGSRRVDEPVSQVDLSPTLLDLLGCPVPAGIDGRSLAAFVRGAAPEAGPTPLYSQLDRSLHGRSALREGPWKVVHGDTSGARVEPAERDWELYDLAADAGEHDDLAPAAGGRLGELRARLDELEAALRSQSGERLRFQPDDELRRRLAQLGYVESPR